MWTSFFLVHLLNGEGLVHQTIGRSIPNVLLEPRFERSDDGRCLSIGVFVSIGVKSATALSVLLEQNGHCAVTCVEVGTGGSFDAIRHVVENCLNLVRQRTPTSALDWRIGEHSQNRPNARPNAVTVVVVFMRQNEHLLNYARHCTCVVFVHPRRNARDVSFKLFLFHDVHLPVCAAIPRSTH